MTPISKSSLSIGTATCDRAPPCSAKRPGTGSVALSALWLTRFVRKTRSIAVPGSGLNSPLRACALSTAAGVLRRRVKVLTVEAEQRSKIGITDARGVLQDGSKYQFQIVGRL